MASDYKTWVFLEMTRIPNQAHNLPQYATHIMGIMKNLPPNVSFGLLFDSWCRLMVVKSWGDFDYQFVLLNMASDLLHLPDAIPLLENPAYHASLETALSIVVELKRKNKDLATELLREFDFAVSRRREEKRRFIKTIQEELIATAMHPDRIEGLIQKYGPTVLECI